MNRAWIFVAPLLLASACGDSHTTDDMGASCHSGDFMAPPVCYLDACCETTEPARAVPGSCGEYECARGALTCTPAPGCGSCGGVDGGPVAPCLGGPCCDEMRSPFANADCSFGCPDGFSFTCEIDPSAFCAPDPRACSQPSDCVVTANTCCGECGQATLDGSTAVNEDALATYRDSLCDDDPICPACPSAPNPELVATCEADRCEVVDLGMDALTECTSSDQCRVRTVDCCECGGATDPGSLIAIRADREGDYAALVCDLGTGCPECAPVYPSDVSAVCDAGRCTLVYEDAP